MKVTEDIYIEDLVEERPKAVKYLLEKDIICIKCGAPVWETLGSLLERHGIKGKEKKRIIAEINEL
jgi:hypothetical protein